MALPDIKSFKDSAAKTLGVGAIALGAASLAFSPVSSPANAQSAQTQQAQTHQVAATSFADGRIRAVHRAQGYDYLRLDSAAKRAHPHARAVDIAPHFPNHLIVYNFVDNSTPEHTRFSNMQTQVLERALGAYAPESKAKRLMLVDIDANAYPVDYATFYGDNELGPNGATRSEYLRPYGVMEGSGIISDTRLFDFALANNARNSADLRENAKSIIGSIGLAVKASNQRQLALLDSPRGP